MNGALTVLAPGLLTTVQDLGRVGLLRYGVTTGGALDQAALVLGNRLVGNEPDAAGLELTLVGPRLRFEAPAVLAITGADLGATCNGLAVPTWQPFQVAAGDEIAFAPGGSSGRPGARAYLCLAGGIAVEPVMGSRGTDLFAHFGGLDGRALRAGDTLAIGEPSSHPADLLRRRLAQPPPVLTPDEPVRVVLGPQQDRFTAEAIERFLSEPYMVTPKADRMGLRLAGPTLELTRGADLISEGIHQGSIQVPGDGQPIALTRARQTIGGYPKIATIIGADLDGLGQRRPGDHLRFTGVDVQTARELTLANRARLGPDAITLEPAMTPGWSPAGTARQDEVTEERAGMANEWNPAAVARLVTDLQAAGVSYLKLEVEPVGLKLELRWGEAGPAPGPEVTETNEEAGPPTPESLAPGGVDVVAPMLGVFYRRPAPEQPPYAEVGQAIEAGQPVGLIEVMKTYHEVPAPAAGTVSEFLVEEGQSVEYGQVIARLG